VKGFKKNGHLDIRYLPKIIRRPLGREKALGQTWHPMLTKVGPYEQVTIEIDNTHHGMGRLDTEIHECLHLLYPSLSEEEVLRGGKWLSKVLYSIGYRLPEDFNE
jgi:hypothetical protein